MDRDIERMVEATGVSLPLAARMVSLVLDSGASQIEVATALEIVRSILSLLPAELVSPNVGPPGLRPTS